MKILQVFPHELRSQLFKFRFGVEIKYADIMALRRADG